ncbi:MAG: hypothetical protein CVV42_04240 [Candidatus Riflebacteria bacterium HGW-Riflebacteria-2]|jgi:predicted Zn-dependent protease|nr:MAG: hypothetical protein CVV42_04240 [Candidatus Riflebacteria bacterium HGW-Riflebacteria-2]
MKKFELIVCYVLVLFCCAVSPVLGAFKAGDSADNIEMQLKAAAESLMTQTNNVSDSRDVAKIWKYVEYLWEKDRRPEARKYIEAGLTFEPFNYYYQAKLARLMADQGRNSEAFDRALIVYEKSEDVDTVEMVLPIIDKSRTTPFKTIEKAEFASPTVVLVTIDDVNHLLVQELQEKINEYTGLDVVIFSESGTPPPPDRSFFTSEIRRMRPAILRMPEMLVWLKSQNIAADSLKADNELFVKTMEKFLEENNPIAAKGFKTNMDLARLRLQQWSYDSLRDYLIAMAAPHRTEKWLLVGITELDMYMADTNYVFAGTNPYGQAIISYRRFMGDFNQEPENRKRLLSRLFKQFLSVFGLLNGMTRCTFPDCARVFPRTLAEHDEKPEYLCNECRQTLEKLLKTKIKSQPARR